MKIRWLILIGGTVEGRVDGVAPGDIMDVPDFNGKRYVANGYAEQVGKTVEHAAVSQPAETAAFVEDQPPPRPEPKVAAPRREPVKRVPRSK